MASHQRIRVLKHMLMQSMFSIYGLFWHMDYFGISNIWDILALTSARGPC